MISKLIYAGLLTVVLSAAAPVPKPTAWQPRPADIAALERGLTMPAGARPLASFRRHYAGVIVDGRRIIRGTFIGGKAGIVVVTSVADLPVICDGGCGIVSVWYDLATATSKAQCNGLA